MNASTVPSSAVPTISIVSFAASFPSWTAHGIPTTVPASPAATSIRPASFARCDASLPAKLTFDFAMLMRYLLTSLALALIASSLYGPHQRSRVEPRHKSTDAHQTSCFNARFFSRVPSPCARREPLRLLWLLVPLNSLDGCR